MPNCVTVLPLASLRISGSRVRRPVSRTWFMPLHLLAGPISGSVCVVGGRRGLQWGDLSRGRFTTAYLVISGDSSPTMSETSRESYVFVTRRIGPTGQRARRCYDRGSVRDDHPDRAGPDTVQLAIWPDDKPKSAVVSGS